MEVITLLDGTRAGMDEITFNRTSYHFIWDSGAAGNIDITGIMKRADKMKFSGFDQRIDNQRIYNETRLGGYGVGSNLNTNTASIFTGQIINNPLAAPIAAADKAIKGAGEALANASGLQVAGGLIALGFVAWLFVQHSKK